MPFILNHGTTCSEVSSDVYCMFCGVLLDSILPSPLRSRAVIHLSLVLVLGGNRWNEWIVRVWVREHRADGKQYCVMFISHTIPE